MKTAKEIKVNNRTRTVIECSLCGAKTRIKGRIDTKRSKAAIERSCGSCSRSRPIRTSDGWWHAFGLKNNPYVYGPMPRMRTSQRYRIEEARRMGWMAWTWDDEYTEQRKGVRAT